MVFNRKFSPPPYLSLAGQLKYSVNIVEKHRQEARVLRQDTTLFKLAKIRAEKEADKWKEKYKQGQEELKKAKQEISKLKQEIEKLTKTNSRYQVSLFDHGNFKSKIEGREKKSKGGQLNHPDTNREGQANFPGYDNFRKRRIYAKNCSKCGSNLDRVNATKQKLLLDIVIKPGIIRMIPGLKFLNQML